MDQDLLKAISLIIAPSVLTLVGVAARTSSSTTHWLIGLGFIAVILFGDLALMRPITWDSESAFLTVLFGIVPGITMLGVLRQRRVRRSPSAGLIAGPTAYVCVWLGSLAIVVCLGGGE